MAKIKVLKDNELIKGTDDTPVYPVTSTKAVYGENNERLDNTIHRIETKVHINKSDISDLKQNVASNTSEIGTINTKFVAIEQDVQNNQSSILRLNEEKATRQELQNTAQGLGQSISSVSALAGSNNTRINALQESVTTNSNDISELKEGKANYADIVNGTIIAGHALLADNAKNAEYATEAGKAKMSDTSTLANAAQTAYNVKATNIEGVLSDEQLSENIRTEVIYDVSERNNGAVFESLQTLLSSSNLTTFIPTSVRRGGMTIRFIQGSEQSSGNKYVQYRYIGTEITDNFFFDEANWQNIDFVRIFEHTDDLEVSILPNVLNGWKEIEKLTINSFQGAQEGCVNEYMLEFTVKGDDFILTLPEGVRWVEEPIWENRYTYQVSIVNNLAVFAGWEAQTNE